jgi:hypothetical protein
VAVVDLEGLPGRIAGVLSSDVASLGAGAVAGLAFLIIAIYLTTRWPALSASGRAALFVLALLVWAIGMFLLDPRLAEQRAEAARWLAGTSVSWLWELVLVATIILFVTTAYATRRHGDERGC